MLLFRFKLARWFPGLFFFKTRHCHTHQNIIQANSWKTIVSLVKHGLCRTILSMSHLQIYRSPGSRCARHREVLQPGHGNIWLCADGSQRSEPLPWPTVPVQCKAGKWKISLDQSSILSLTGSVSLVLKTILWWSVLIVITMTHDTSYQITMRWLWFHH